jgi:hypothetical protein
VPISAATGRGVFWSTNGGAGWSPLKAGLTNLNVQTLLIDPRNPDTVYAGTYDGRMFAMTLGGACCDRHLPAGPGAKAAAIDIKTNYLTNVC